MLNLTKEQRVLLDLIKVGIVDPEHEAADTDIDWEQVIAESRSQAVLLLACDSAAPVKDHIPEELFKQWKAAAFKGMMNNMRVQQAQRDMVSILSGRQYPYMILKGLAAAHYYPRPELRALGDVDFLIDPEMKEELSQLFVNHDYSQHLENHICHVVFKKPGAHLEMHFEPSGIPNGDPGEYVRKYFDKAVYRAVEAEQGGDVFCMPEPALHGMILALHMQHHQVSEGLGLRHLCDWGCFVHQTADEEFWDEMLTDFERIGLITYIRLMTKTCSMYLGTRLPEWAADADPQVCEAVIEDIFAGGNFGRKDELRSKSGMMISNHGKDGTGHNKAFYLYQILHASSAENNAAVTDSKIRWLAEDVKRAVMYLIRTVKGERTSLIKMMPEADKRKKIYDEFHLFETQNTKERI